VVYSDERGQKDHVCLCKCNHTKESHNKDGFCRVKKKVSDGGKEKVVQCHCSIYLGPEDYRDVLFCAPHGVISKRVKKAFSQIGWEIAPPGSDVATLRGVLRYQKGLTALRQFTEKEYSVENIAFLLAIQKFKQWAPQLDEVPKKVEEANEIIKNFIDDGAQQQINLPGTTSRKCHSEIKEITDKSATIPTENKPRKSEKNYKISNLEAAKVLKALKKASTTPDFDLVFSLERLTPEPQPLEDRLYHMFDEAEDDIFNLVKKDTYPRFTKGDSYREMSKTARPAQSGCLIC